MRILDDLTTSAADLRFVGVAKISGSGTWTPVNTGTDTSLVIEDTALGIDIPAGEQVVVEITVVLEDTTTNVAGLTFTNTADYTYDRAEADATSQRPGSPGTTPPMTIVEPLLTLTKGGPAQMTVGTPETFSLDIHNASQTPAWNLTILDRLPDGSTGGTWDAAPTAVSAQVFQADGTTPVAAPLVQGTDFAVGFTGAPSCEMNLTFLSRPKDAKPDTCTERGDVYPTRISVTEGAQYPGRSGGVPLATGIARFSEASPEVSRGHSSDEGSWRRAERRHRE